MLSSLSSARRRLFLFVAVVASLAVVVALATALVQGRGEPVVPAAQDQPGPLLLVPGYGGSTTSLESLAGYLQSKGRDATIVDLPGDATGDIRDQARALSDAVDEALDRSGAESVDLVGYSAGGEVVRWYVGELGGDALTRRVVTLSSPHHGTELAALAGGLAGDACPEACQQLAPDSDLLRELNRDDETPDGPLWVAIWTDDDQTVVPPDSGSLEGALDYSVQSVCPDLHVEHGDMPATAPTVLMVEAALGTDDPTVPGDGVCSRKVDLVE